MLNTHFSGLVQLVYFVFCLLANMPNRLQCLNVPIVSDEDCEKAYPGMITRRMVCAGYMDGGRDACNVRTAANERRHRCALAHTPSMFFDRETPAAPWCVSEKSMAWCRGVRGVPFPNTPESTSKCANSSTGSIMSYKPTLKENHLVVSLKPLGISSFSFVLCFNNRNK